MGKMETLEADLRQCLKRQQDTEEMQRGMAM